MNPEQESQTSAQYDEVIKICKDIFLKKTADYGESWRVLRLPSITDQIYIKVRRIRRLEELNGIHRIPEDVDTEYIGIINYCVMALIKLASSHRTIEDKDITANETQDQCAKPSPRSNSEHRGRASGESGDVYDSRSWFVDEKSICELSKQYDAVIAKTKDLMERKNYDYGEAWRGMRLSSITDQILVKTLRAKQIEEHEGQVLVSEGLEAEYNDILNWCVFALIRLDEEDVFDES